MTDARDHPDYRRALDRSLPVPERQAALEQAGQPHDWHVHPLLGAHAHPGPLGHEHRSKETP